MTRVTAFLNNVFWQILNTSLEKLKENGTGVTIDFRKYKDDIATSIIGQRLKVDGKMMYPILDQKHNKFFVLSDD